MIAPTLTATTIRKNYGKSTPVNSVSFEVSSGSVHGLLGPNGSGKTTTLHIVTGLLDSDGGEVTISGRGIADKASRASFGFAPDDLALPTALTGREFLTFHDTLRARDDRERAKLLADALGIAADLDKLVVEYSHGMQRKLQLIAAVMHNPRLLVLDEPFRGLDPEASVTVRTLLSSFVAGGGAVLVATHDMLRAERECDTVTILSDGRTVAQGSPASLRLANEGCSSLEDVFMRVTGRDSDMARRADAVATAFTTKTFSPRQRGT
jgi:ABC-2 type transport system ATP-binding protein